MAKIKNAHLDRMQEKQKKQKKLLFVLLGVLGLALVYEVPHTMKMMNHSAKPPVVSAAGAAPAANPAATTSTPLPAAAQAAPQPATPSVSSTAIVASVPVQADTGQLTQFERFASKDPFLQSVQKLDGAAASSSSSSSSSSKGAAPKTPTAPQAPATPPAPPPGSAVISLNGELMSVDVDTDFPTQGTVFGQVGGPLFHLDSLTQKTAKVSIAGGSYADGAPSLTLHVGQAVTLQNTADGSRYTLILEPQGTQVPQTTTTTSTSTVPQTSTTPSVVPSSGG